MENPKDQLLLALRAKEFSSTRPKKEHVKKKVQKYMDTLKISPPMRIDEIARTLGAIKDNKPVTGGILAWYRRYANRCRTCGDDQKEHDLQPDPADQTAYQKVCSGKGGNCKCGEYVKSDRVQIIYIKGDPLPYVVESQWLQELQGNGVKSGSTTS